MGMCSNCARHLPHHSPLHTSMPLAILPIALMFSILWPARLAIVCTPDVLRPWVVLAERVARPNSLRRHRRRHAPHVLHWLGWLQAGGFSCGSPIDCCSWEVPLHILPLHTSTNLQIANIGGGSSHVTYEAFLCAKRRFPTLAQSSVAPPQREEMVSLCRAQSLRSEELCRRSWCRCVPSLNCCQA